jgi:hypothetical protein
MEWLDSRGFKVEQPALAMFGDNAGKPVGMKSSDDRVGFCAEYDERSCAKINAFSIRIRGCTLPSKEIN